MTTVYGTPDPYSTVIPDTLATDAEVAAEIAALDLTDPEVTTYEVASNVDITAADNTFVTATGLTIPMLLDKAYEMTGIILYACTDVAIDYKFRLTYPTLDEAAGAWGTIYGNNATDAAAGVQPFTLQGSTTQWRASGSETAIGTPAALTSIRLINFRFYIYNSGSAGDCVYQFAKVNANAGTLRTCAGSRIVTRVLN